MGNRVIKISVGSLIVIFMLVAILGVIYFKTDLLRPSGELFQKYFNEGMQNIDNALEFSNEQQYVNIFYEKEYNEETQALLKYKNSQENEETLTIAITGDTSNQSNKSYRDINMKYSEDDEVIKLNFLQENDLYGILFLDVVRQYVSMDVQKADAIFEVFDIDKDKLSEFLTKYNPKEILNTLMDNKKYIISTAMDTISKANKKQYKYIEEESITLNNGQSITTKKYQLTLSKNQTQSVILDVLEKIGAKEKLNEIQEKNIDFSEATIEIYALENKVSRMDIKYNDINIIIDFYENEINIKYSSANVSGINIDIKDESNDKVIKCLDNGQNVIELRENIINGEDINKLNATLSIKTPNIQKLDIEVQQKLETKEDVLIDKSFEELENVNLSNVENNNMNALVSSLLERINNKLQSEQQSIHYELIDLWINQNSKVIERCKNLKEKQKNEFNNQFLMYKGNKVEKNIVYNMLDLAEKNLSSYQVNGEDKTRIIIEEGKENHEMAEKIKERIEKAQNSDFNISFEYNNEGKINAIIIIENIEKEQ